MGGGVVSSLRDRPAEEVIEVIEIPGGDFPDDDLIDEPPRPSKRDDVDVFAQFEEPEIAGEDTRIDEGHLLAEASTSITELPESRPRVEVERGKDEGRQFVLQEGRNTVGRGMDNDIILSDVAISRRHLHLELERGELQLRDLGAGNGTRLNGTRTRRAVLQEGDRLELGETRLVVRIPGMAPRESEIPTVVRVSNDEIVLPKAAVVVLLVGGASVVGALLILVAWLAFRTPETPPAAAPTPSHFARGIAAYEAEHWEEAQAAFAEALAHGEGGAQASAFLRRSRLAVHDAEALDAARHAVDSEDPSAAREAVLRVREEESPLFEEARRLRAQIEERWVAQLLEDGRAALHEGDLTSAERQLAEAIGIAGDTPAVAALREAISAGASEIQADAQEEADPRRPRRSPRDRAIRAYLAGDFASSSRIAGQAAHGPRADTMRALATQIDRFAVLWRQIRAAGFNSSVRRQMSEAMGLDAQIARSPHYRRQLREPLVRATLAEASGHRGNPSAACAAVQAAARIDPRHAEVRRRSTRCEAAARGMLRGAARQAPALQVSTYREVLMMVPQVSPVARDARTRLAALRRRRSVDEDE